MSESRVKILVDLGLGLATAVGAAFLFDLFHAPNLQDALRILSDSFFLPAVLFLGIGGLTWTKNGGVWDGIGFTFKTVASRMRRNYDEERITFAQYREERAEKNSSPKSALITGAVYLVLALVFLIAYNKCL